VDILKVAFAEQLQILYSSNGGDRQFNSLH